jgi:hypothetical protein
VLRGGIGVRPPACIPSMLTEHDMCDGAEGTFGIGPPACIPNTRCVGEIGGIYSLEPHGTRGVYRVEWL